MVCILSEDDFQSLYSLLNQVDSDFSPTLSSRVDLEQYALKLLKVARVFGIYQKKELLGAMAIYMNDLDSKVAYCPFIAVLSDFRGNGFSQKLIETSIMELKSKKFSKLLLTVRVDSPACYLYKKVGFKVTNEFRYDDTDIQGYEMELKL